MRRIDLFQTTENPKILFSFVNAFLSILAYVFLLPAFFSFNTEPNLSKIQDASKILLPKYREDEQSLIKVFPVALEYLWIYFWDNDMHICIFREDDVKTPNKNIKTQVPRMTCALPCLKPGARGRCWSHKAHKTFQTVCALSHAGTGQGDQVLPPPTPPKF